MLKELNGQCRNDNVKFNSSDLSSSRSTIHNENIVLSYISSGDYVDQDIATSKNTANLVYPIGTMRKLIYVHSYIIFLKFVDSFIQEETTNAAIPCDGYVKETIFVADKTS